MNLLGCHTKISENIFKAIQGKQPRHPMVAMSFFFKEPQSF